MPACATRSRQVSVISVSQLRPSSVSLPPVSTFQAALVASALSVGIGFGLQNIVSNFVSGLILLVERPFKVGDWVVTGTTEGTVKRLSVRATEIETFRGQSIIVPNSEFINSSVGNWTHRNRIMRAEIPVSVSYDSDPQKVMDILLELVRAQPPVLRNPEPHVEFLRFGDFSLDFELRFHLADLSNGLGVKNALRIAILQRFREEGSTSRSRSATSISTSKATPIRRCWRRCFRKRATRRWWPIRVRHPRCRQCAGKGCRQGGRQDCCGTASRGKSGRKGQVSGCGWYQSGRVRGRPRIRLSCGE